MQYGPEPGRDSGPGVPLASEELWPRGVRPDRGKVARLPLPAQRISLNGEIGRELAQQILHARESARVCEADAVRGMPFQEMREVTRADVTETARAVLIVHTKPPCLLNIPS
jgi:hypothetical protein